jgi:hypothetical protein
MGVAAAVFAADWSNKFLIVHKTGALSHTRRAPTPSVWRAPRYPVVRPHFAVPSPKTGVYGLYRRWQGKGSLDVPEADRAADAPQTLLKRSVSLLATMSRPAPAAADALPADRLNARK